MVRTRRHSRLILALLAGTLVLAPRPLVACGWWGDSAGESDSADVVGPEGEIVSSSEPETPEEMARLSRAYREGDGVPEDPILARLWAQRAAEAGHAGAMNDFGQMLEAGLGGWADEREAVAWYKEAAERGVAEAQHSLAMMLRAGRGVARDPAAADRWLRRAAARGHASAAAELATRIWEGEVARQSPDEGCFWWLVALRQGHPGEPQRCRDARPGLSDEAFRSIQARAAAWRPGPSASKGGDT